MLLQTESMLQEYTQLGPAFDGIVQDYVDTKVSSLLLHPQTCSAVGRPAQQLLTAAQASMAAGQTCRVQTHPSIRAVEATLRCTRCDKELLVCCVPCPSRCNSGVDLMALLSLLQGKIQEVDRVLRTLTTVEEEWVGEKQQGAGMYY